MPVTTRKLEMETNGNADIRNITDRVQAQLAGIDITNGAVTIFVPGATGAITTIEYEPGLLQDLPELLDKLIPPANYQHDQTWHDGNGHSHLRASMIGPSLTVPFSGSKLLLGTWQQIIFIDFDVRPRRREIILQFIGE